MDEAKVIERVALIAHDEPPEIAEPSEEPLDLPPSAIAPEWTPILRLGTHPPAAMGRGHRDAPVRQH